MKNKKSIQQKEDDDKIQINHLPSFDILEQFSKTTKSIKFMIIFMIISCFIYYFMYFNSKKTSIFFSIVMALIASLVTCIGIGFFARL